MSKFKVGDRVRASAQSPKGKVGSIIKMVRDGSGCDFLVEFDDWYEGHDGVCYGWSGGKSRQCWWCYSNNLVLLTNNKIVITTDGKTTLARLYEGDKVVKSTEAKCCPEDEFVFEKGASLAYNRLMYGTDYHPSEVKIVAKKFDWDAFKKEKIAVHCDTETKAKAFLKECHDHGFTWTGPDKENLPGTLMKKELVTMESLERWRILLLSFIAKKVTQ